MNMEVLPVWLGQCKTGGNTDGNKVYCEVDYTSPARFVGAD